MATSGETFARIRHGRRQSVSSFAWGLMGPMETVRGHGRCLIEDWLCTDEPLIVGNTGGTVRVTKCPNGSYCCGVGSEADSCCTTGAGVWIARNGQTTGVKPGATSRSSTTLPAPTTIGTSSSISTTIPTAAPVSSQTSSAPGATVTQTTTEPTTNTGAIAGSAVAGVVAAALIIGAAVWALRRRRDIPIEEKQIWVPSMVKRPALYAGEMEGSNAGRELPADTGAHEMDTEGPSHKQHRMPELA
ncbi:MAG: hypothetical protein Q9210_003550 [Variospora velana]